MTKRMQKGWGTLREDLVAIRQQEEEFTDFMIRFYNTVNTVVTKTQWNTDVVLT